MLKVLPNVSIYLLQILYCSGSGHAPGEVYPITVQNSIQAKNIVARLRLPIPGEPDESKDEVQTSTAAILRRTFPPNYNSITKENKKKPCMI